MIALALGGRTIAEWQATMSESEFMAWRDYYEAFPFCDLHRYHRPASLVAHSMTGADMRELLEWLQPDPRDAHLNEADRNTLAAFGFKRA